MENISTLMDGEHNVETAESQILRLESDSVMRETWDTYHLIGDVMRGGGAGNPGFAARISERLAQEPTVLAPRATRRVRHWAHNVRDHALGLAASVAAVAAVGLMATTTLVTDSPEKMTKGLSPAPAPSVAVSSVPGSAPAAANSLAPAPAPLAAASPSPAGTIPESVPAERMQEYLMAHQGVSPSTAIQGVTPYIRTVSAGDE